MTVFFHRGHDAGFGGSRRISKYRKKITVDRVVPSKSPEIVDSVGPRSVTKKSTLTHMGTNATNIKSTGRKIQLRSLRNRFMKRRNRSPSGISGCLKTRAST